MLEMGRGPGFEPGQKRGLGKSGKMKAGQKQQDFPSFSWTCR